jgi:CheY-like chemotaxis protein
MTAHDALAASPADFVLLDLGLPDDDGLRVCREPRRRHSCGVVATWTGEFDPERCERVLRGHAPFDENFADADHGFAAARPELAPPADRSARDGVRVVSGRRGPFP